jgi:hypothetical protein
MKDFREGANEPRSFDVSFPFFPPELDETFQQIGAIICEELKHPVSHHWSSTGVAYEPETGNLRLTNDIFSDRGATVALMVLPAYLIDALAKKVGIRIGPAPELPIKEVTAEDITNHMRQTGAHLAGLFGTRGFTEKTREESSHRWHRARLMLEHENYHQVEQAFRTWMQSVARQISEQRHKFLPAAEEERDTLKLRPLRSITTRGSVSIRCLMNESEVFLQPDRRLPALQVNKPSYVMKIELRLDNTFDLGDIGLPGFELHCDADGNITVTKTSDDARFEATTQDLRSAKSVWDVK